MCAINKNIKKDQSLLPYAFFSSSHNYYLKQKPKPNWRRIRSSPELLCIGRQSKHIMITNLTFRVDQLQNRRGFRVYLFDREMILFLILCPHIDIVCFQRVKIMNNFLFVVRKHEQGTQITFELVNLRNPNILHLN